MLIGASMMGLGVLAMLVQVRDLEADNARLRDAFRAAVARAPSSCEVAEGERVICALREGQLSRLALDPSDQVVSLKRPVGAPIGKHRRHRRASPP